MRPHVGRSSLLEWALVHAPSLLAAQSNFFLNQTTSHHGLYIYKH